MSDRTHMVLRAACVVPLAAFAGCYNPSFSAVGTCARDTDCPEGYVCDFGQSPPTCNTHRTDPTNNPPGADATTDIDAGADAPPTPDAAAPQTPRLVQEAPGGAATGAFSLSLAQLPTAGNVLILAAGAGQAPISQVSGGGVTAWNRAIRSVIFCNEEIWYGTTDGSSATVAIQLPTANKGTIFGSLTEWSGLASATPPEAAASMSRDSSPAMTGAITTRHATDLLVFAASTGAPVTWGTVAPGDWTALKRADGGANLCEQALWYRVVTATDSYAPSVTESGTTPWDAAMAAFIVSP